MFKITIDENINSLRRLKDKINEKLNRSMERTKVYNYKGLELDDNDIEYLKHNDSLYLSLDGNIIFYIGSSFSVLNYVNEYEFIKWIKSGGYGSVYLGTYLLI
jgi:hypothetical protein